MLPISVILPTRNAAERIASHLATLQPWIDQAHEVIVVDGESTDGTVEMVRSHLHHPRLKLLSRPPGLYAAWNDAVAQSSAKFVYFTTVGDTITEAGLRHLLETAQRFNADLVLSPPRFQRLDGTFAMDKQWTIHRYLKARNITLPALLSGAHLFVTSIAAGPSGMMGSSASNLYCSRVLQNRPFPLDFGHVGDTAWGIANAFSIRVAVTPQFCATFLLHPNAGEVPATEEARLAKELLTLARRTLHEGLSGSVASAQAATLGDFIAKCDTLGEAIRKEHSTYLAHRKRCGWFLHPSAWQARCNRNTHRATLDELWLRALTQFNSVSL